MKLLLICSKQFYSKIEEIKSELENNQIEIFLPNCYDAPTTEDEMRKIGPEAHRDFKSRMFKQSEETIKNMDAVLVLNYDKNKNGIIYKNYIGGATFLEMYEAFRYGKKIYLMNDIPEGILFDEIDGFDPMVINGDLNLIKNNKSKLLSKKAVK